MKEQVAASQDTNAQVQQQPPVFFERMASAMPWLVTSALAVLAGGLTAAVVAHAPTQPLVWMSAYLVLVAGLGQAGLGVGQAMLSTRLASRRFVAVQWVVLNAANAGVVAGTLLGQAWLVATGITGFVLALAMFLRGVHGNRGGWQVQLFRAMVALLTVSAMVGMALSLFRNLR